MNSPKRGFYRPKSLEQFMMQRCAKGRSFYTEMQASHVTSMANRSKRKVTTNQIIGWKRLMGDAEKPKFYRILRVTFLNKPPKS